MLIDTSSILFISFINLYSYAMNIDFFDVL